MTASTAMIGLPELELTPLKQTLSLFGGIKIGRHISHYPDHVEMGRLLRATNPDILFISTALPDEMETAVMQTYDLSPNIEIIIVDGGGQSNALKRAMQLGVRECVSLPFHEEDVKGAVERCMKRRTNVANEGPASNCLYSFLPARGGVGASFLAMQAALYLPVDAKHRGLLVDGDLDAGMIHFMLKVQNPYSLIEALERVEDLNHIWQQLIAVRGHLDIMQSSDFGGDYNPHLDRLQSILTFVQRRYSAVLVDLPSAINRLSVEIMQQSSTVYLVTTPEVASLHMARRRWRALQDFQLGHQVKLIVNRLDWKEAGAISTDEIASVVGLPVHAAFSNDYMEVQKAILTGNPVPAWRPLGLQLKNFADSLLLTPTPVAPPRKHRFLEVFAVAR